jgi:hypothetical protein
MAVFLLLYVMVLLVVNHREMFRLENRRKMTRNRLLYMGRIVKQTYRMGMVLAVFFFAAQFLSGSLNTFFPDNSNQEKTVNESKMDRNEMSKALSATKWNAMSTSEKISWLQIITDYTAKEYLGCDTVSVEVAPLGKKVWGCYWDALSSESIYISSSLVKSGEPKDVVFTVLHELYHHYEYLCISEVNFNSRNVSELYYFEQIRQWKENASNYIEADKEGYDAYAEQPLEESANSYAEKMTELYFKDVE